jgi:hypothetical protein
LPGGRRRLGQGRIRRRLQHGDDQIRRIEVGAVQQIEHLEAQLQRALAAEVHVLERREIDRRQARSRERVAPDGAVEPAVARRRDECRWIEPLSPTAGHHGSGERRIQKRPHRIARVAIVRRVVAQLFARFGFGLALFGVKSVPAGTGWPASAPNTGNPVVGSSVVGTFA